MLQLLDTFISLPKFKSCIRPCHIMKFETLENNLSTSRSTKMFRPQIKTKQLFLRSSGSTDSVFKKLPIDLHGNDRLMLLLSIIILILTVSNFGAGMYVLLTRA